MISGTNWRIVATVLAGLGQLFTTIRIVYQCKKGRFWFDDLVGAFALMSSIAGLVALWFYSNVIEQITHSSFSIKISYWTVSMMHIAVVWLSRLSISLTLAKNSPPEHRRLPYFVVSLCAIMGTGLLIQRGVLCGVVALSWSSNSDDHPRCNDLSMIATTLALEFSSSLITLYYVARAYALYENSSLRKSIFVASFVASGFILGASVSHAVFLIRKDNGGSLENLTASIQSGVSLMVTNLPTLIATLYLSSDAALLKDPEAFDSKSTSPPLTRNISKPFNLNHPTSDSSDWESSYPIAVVRGSFFPKERDSSVGVDFLPPPLPSFRSSGVSKQSWISESSYSQQSATYSPYPGQDSGSINDLILNPPPMIYQSQCDSISNVPSPISSSYVSDTGSAPHSPMPRHVPGFKTVRFLSKLISDRYSARSSFSSPGVGGESVSGSPHLAYLNGQSNYDSHHPGPSLGSQPIPF